MCANRQNGSLQNVSSYHADKINYLSNPVHKIIEHHAKETPNAIAVRYCDEKMTYAELNQAANNLAFYLHSMQVGAEDRIAVCLEPSVWFLVSLLGILKAGAVYVPLDPGHPPARIKHIIEEGMPVFVLSERSLIERLGLKRLPFLYMDTIPQILHEKNTSCIPQANQTAYIFFTSGSTGNPKGVMASHENLTHYTGVAVERYQMNATTVMPAIARFSFSISLFELLCPLVAGGTVWVLDREHVFNMPKLAKILSQVSMFHAGPSLLKSLLPYIRNNVDDLSIFQGIQHASSGGDAIPPDVLESLKEIFSNAEIFVIYGSSEIACMGCTWLVPRDQRITKTYAGHPFPEMDIRIVDNLYNEVPPGVDGEVCFSGKGVFKNYLDNSDLAKDKIITINSRQYFRMGDLGCIDETGKLALLGRIDFQIKIRGMRVEPGEIESLLRSAPGVHDGVVAGRELGTGDKSLVAYVVFKDRSSIDLHAIHTHLSHQLPDYMLPSCYVELTTLPLNANMKLDRKALPDPRGEELYRMGGRVIRPPQTTTELCLAAMLQKLLSLNDVGLDDNFFDLGGHSLAAIEFKLQIGTSLGVNLEGMDILRESVEVISRIIDQYHGKEIPVERPGNLQTTPQIVTETFFFGHDDSLYGVFHKPQGTLQKAVLICSPAPYENERLDFILNRLSKRLVLNGIATFQFHYFGTRDSKGDGAIARLSRWREDVIAAGRELTLRLDNTPIIGLGVRLGATLLWDAREELSCESMVFWDPVIDGKQYLLDMETHHREIIADRILVRNGRPVKGLQDSRELLGTTWSEAALNEMAALALAPSTVTVPPVIWIATTDLETQMSAFLTISASQPGWHFQRESLDPGLRWLKSVDKIPDTGLSKTLATALGAL